MSGRRATWAASSLLFSLLLGAAILGTAGEARADTCTCDIDLSSTSRWMNPWWALECDEHCGHGYVSSDCDTAHGQGCGAMTGNIKLRYSSGSTFRERGCSDDHWTCFRGPSACDDGGAWGNVCSADIWHCLAGGYGDGSWECNGLTDNTSVYQLGADGVTFAGACGTNWFNVLEFIQEEDPWCCDDAMGHLNVSTWTAEGWSIVYLYPGAQNCNGGSQSGVYPHCGTFGATLAVITNCFTSAGATGGGGGDGGGGPKSLGGLPEDEIDQQRALADSIARRERKLAETPRNRVESEVTERARSLGVKAAVPELVDLLFEAAIVELDRDRCQVEQPATTCADFQRRLGQLDARFKKLSGGVTIRDFRSGATLAGPPPAPAAPAPRP